MHVYRHPPTMCILTTRATYEKNMLTQTTFTPTHQRKALSAEVNSRDPQQLATLRLLIINKSPESTHLTSLINLTVSGTRSHGKNGLDGKFYHSRHDSRPKLFIS